ncbi:MAG: Gldg family protein, partial [Deltaproteobacteria bacterium]
IMKLNIKVSSLLNLTCKILLKLYLSSSLTQVSPYMGLDQLSDIPGKLKDVVETLNEKYFDKLAFEYLDPTADPALFSEAESKNYNLMNLKWQNIPSKNIQAGSGAIGLVMEYGSKAVTIHLMRVFKLPILGTRYELVDIDQMEEIIGKNLESLIDINEELGYLADHGTPQLFATPPLNPANQIPPEVLNNFRALASQNYSLKNITLKDEDIPASLKSLIIAGPTEAFTEYELFQIDQHLMQGKSLVLFIDKFNEILPPRQMAAMGQGPQYIPLDTGLEKLLAHYGIHIKKSYVMDKNCFKQEIPAQLGGGERPIYWAPLIENRLIGKELDFMKNIKQLVAVKASPLELDLERIKQKGLKAYRLFASSEESWEMKDRINLNPMLIFPPQSSEEMQSFSLAYILEGEFSSYFEGKPLPVKEAAEDKTSKDSPTSADSSQPDQDKQNDQKPAVDLSKIETESPYLAKGKPGRIFIMASTEMLTDSVLDAQGRSLNAVFIMNLLDTLNDREEIAVLRSKKQRFNPLANTGAFTKTVVKSFNIAGLPVLVVLFGLVVWARRISRKKNIQLMFQK